MADESFPETHGETREVTRSVELDAGADEVWRAVTDPGERALWLDDPDALEPPSRLAGLAVSRG